MLKNSVLGSDRRNFSPYKATYLRRGGIRPNWPTIVHAPALCVSRAISSDFVMLSVFAEKFQFLSLRVFQQNRLIAEIGQACLSLRDARNKWATLNKVGVAQISLKNSQLPHQYLLRFLKIVRKRKKQARSRSKAAVIRETVCFDFVHSRHVQAVALNKTLFNKIIHMITRFACQQTGAIDWLASDLVGQRQH